MRPASFGAVSGRRPQFRGRDTKETKMREYSLSELFNLTRAELFALHAQIAAELPALFEADREIALDNLRKLRLVLAQIRPGP
jgi:hypothetical protein